MSPSDRKAIGNRWDTIFGAPFAFAFVWSGRRVMWNNMNPDGTMNYKTLHTGTPVKAGCKHIITQWYRQNNWLQLNSGG